MRKEESRRALDDLEAERARSPRKTRKKKGDRKKNPKGKLNSKRELPSLGKIKKSARPTHHRIMNQPGTRKRGKKPKRCQTAKLGREALVGGGEGSGGLLRRSLICWNIAKIPWGD